MEWVEESDRSDLRQKAVCKHEKESLQDGS